MGAPRNPRGAAAGVSLDPAQACVLSAASQADVQPELLILDQIHCSVWAWTGTRGNLHWLWVSPLPLQSPRVQVLAYEMWGKLLNLSEPQFPYLLNGLITSLPPEGG